MRNMAWFRLKEKEQVAVLLRLVVVGKESFLKVGSILEMTSDFVLLWYLNVSKSVSQAPEKCENERNIDGMVVLLLFLSKDCIQLTSSSAMRF
jgi:hypothetical protein